MKKEKYLLQLVDLVRVINKSELRIVRKHIKAYESNLTTNSKKMLQLFNHVVQKENIDYEKLKKKISNESADASFNRLINRLLDRIQESLILDVNLYRKDAYDEIFRHRYQIRKQLMQAQILKSRGLIIRANKIYSNVINTSKKYELYDELIESLILKQTLNSNIEGAKLYNKFNEEINKFQVARDCLSQANQIYKSYFNKVYTKAKRNPKIFDLESKLEKLNGFYMETGSNNIYSLYLLLKIEYHSITDYVNLEIESALELIEVIKNNKSVYSRQRLVYINFTLADTEIGRLEFKSALNYANESLKWTQGKKNLNFLIAIENKIKALYFLGNYKQAIVLIDQVLKQVITEKYQFNKSKILYINACCLFNLGEYKQANNLLNNLSNIEKDKEGWNVWSRIMRILVSLELFKLNLVDYDVENFRKFIQRISKESELFERERLITRILIDLEKSNFNYASVAKNNGDQLNLLRSTEKEYCWSPKTPELILFHDWFLSKVNETVYSPHFDSYKKTIKKSESVDNSVENSSLNQSQLKLNLS